MNFCICPVDKLGLTHLIGERHNGDNISELKKNDKFQFINFSEATIYHFPNFLQYRRYRTGVPKGRLFSI
jgi:hypothetical protein